MLSIAGLVTVPAPHRNKKDALGSSLLPLPASSSLFCYLDSKQFHREEADTQGSHIFPFYQDILQYDSAKHNTSTAHV